MKCLIFCLLGLFLFPDWSAAQDAAAWPVNVPGFVEPAPGEHPRLFFRKADVPALRDRMNTEEGKAILARLRLLLGNEGKALPDSRNRYHPVNIRARGQEELPLGSFTISHAAGYGFLYVLTGEQSYAELAQKSLELMFDEDLYSVSGDVIQAERGKHFQPRTSRWEGKSPSQVITRYGQPDRDERYTWTRPGAKLRLGAMMLSVAMAYDFCYDAWSPEFRQRVVNEIQNYERLPVDYDKFAEGHKGLASMDVLVNPPFPPRSNHHGAYVGGAGIALLAIRNDPGADMKRIRPWLKQVEQEMIRVMTQGFGDKGFFAEGHGPSHMAANNAFVPLLQAARISWGKDFISPRSNAPWITLRWAMEIIPHAEKAWYPNYKINPYGSDHKWRGSMSDGGEWSQGFGALANEDQQAAMLWMYEHAIEKEKPLREFDAWTYPHRAVFAFINWPIGLEPKNPGEVLGHANADLLIGHFMFRREWNDAKDVYVTFLLNKDPRRGYVRSSSGGHITLWGQGIRERVFFRCNQRARITAYDVEEDGSGVMAFEMEGQQHSLAVDFGKTSGAEAVVIIANPWFERPDAFLEKRQKSLEALEKDIASGKRNDPAARMQFAYLDDGTTAFMIMNLHPKGALPDIRQQGNQLQVGQQRYRFDGTRLFMEH